MSDEPHDQDAGGTAGPLEEQEDLSQEVRRAARAIWWARALRWPVGVACATSTVCFWYRFYTDVLGAMVAHRVAPVWPFIALGPCIGALGLCGFLLERWERRAERHLARGTSVRSVGPLLAAIGQPRGWDSGLLKGRAVALLTDMRPAEYAALTVGQRRAMLRILVHADRPWWRRGWTQGPYPGLQAAILKMLQQCGGPEWLQPAAYLTRNARYPRVRTVAQECLEYLQARLEEERPAATLLRPAEAPEEATLLRPAQASPETPEERLLRPAAREDEG